MTAPSRARPWHRLTAALAGLLTAFAIGAVGQPPVEEEDPKGGVKKKIVVDDPVIAKKDSGPGATPDVRLDELARGAEEATHPAVKKLYLEHVVPFDLLKTKGGEGRVRPIEHMRGGRMPDMKIEMLGANGKITGTSELDGGVVLRVDYFEEIALKAANAVLDAKPFGTKSGPDGWVAIDQLNAAERVMAAALRFHDYARERNVRKGKGWDDVRKPLADRLREVRLFQMKNAVATSDWPRLRETSSRLMILYPKDAGVAAEVASARVLEAKRLLESERHFDHVKARELLDEFEARYPGSGGEPVRALRDQITKLAQKAFTRAKDKKNANDLVTARDSLAQAAALDPTLPGLRDMQRELKAGYQTLYVGVRDYPVMMSPSTARLDSEKQVVELLFEGLLSEVPDDGGGARYRPGTAAAMPAVVPNGREFHLRTFDRDPSGRFGFESHDVVGTLKLLQTRPDTWAAYPLPWFDELPTPKDNATVRIAFKQGHPDPRSLLTFKLLPARYLLDTNKRVDDAGFATEKPAGTGPYRIQLNPKADGNTPREMVLVDNPLYGRWRDRTNQPFIKEIRLVEVSKVHNVVESFQQGSLHVLTDVPTAELEKFMGPAANLTGKVQVSTSTNNRRIHMLAVNHRRPQMQSKALRQGLSMAIDRDAILSDVFRAGKNEFHRQMGGPFPPKSWASVKAANGSTIPLVNPFLAVTKLKTYLGDMGAKSEVTLSYPNGDPQAALACNKIKAQVEGLFKDSPGRKLTIVLEPLPLRELLQRVEDEHRYDLAYVPFDYPDDWYPYALGALLDPQAAESGGRNCMGFLQKNTGADDQDTRLGQLLNELRAFREFGSLSMKSAEVHKLFNECVPFIPLWQLDRHILVHNSVKVYTDDTDAPVSPRVLNPTTLFQGIARWRLEG